MYVIANLPIDFIIFGNGYLGDSVILSTDSTNSELPSVIVLFLTHTVFEERFEFGVVDN